MKKFVSMIILLVIIGISLTRADPVISKYDGIHKGNFIDGSRIIVSSSVATNLISSNTFSYTDWAITNLGPNSIWIDSSTAVGVTGSTEGYKMPSGSSISTNGRTYGISVWSLSETGNTTAYILIFEDR